MRAWDRAETLLPSLFVLFARGQPRLGGLLGMGRTEHCANQVVTGELLSLE